MYLRYSLKKGIFVNGRKLFQQTFEVKNARFQLKLLFRFYVFQIWNDTKVIRESFSTKGKWILMDFSLLEKQNKQIVKSTQH